jgi:hypothetical protein
VFNSARIMLYCNGITATPRHELSNLIDVGVEAAGFASATSLVSG